MPSSQLPLTDCLETAVTAAHAAAAILQAHAHRRADLVISTKQLNDLVSQADHEAEEAILDILRERTPSLGIVAEESGGEPAGKASWYIDPLDGTTNFLHGLPHYAVSIALVAHPGAHVTGEHIVDRDTPVIAVIYDPVREELFTAMHGVGAWVNNTRIRCSNTPVLAERSEEHTSELQSRGHLVCRLLLEKKKQLLTGTELEDKKNFNVLS